MDTESVIAYAFVAAIALACSWIGWLGRSRRIDFAMGGSTRENSTHASWEKANRSAGNYFLAYGATCAIASAVGLAFGPASSDGVFMDATMGLVVAATLALAIGVMVVATRITPSTPQ